MSIVIYLMLTLQSSFLNELNNYDLGNNTDTSKITVIGKAIVRKHHAAVLTQDSLVYYLDGIDDWDIKYEGKKVKVTGEIETKHELPKYNTPRVAITRQTRPASWKTIKKPEWSLVE